MSRLDRLYALAERLRRPGGATVPMLAVELGVTERTVQRDLARLREQGLNIEGEPGRGGGLRLRGASPAPPLGLSLGEALRLALGHRISSALGVLPSGATLDLLLAKLQAGLPRDAARRLAAVLARVVVGPSVPDPSYAGAKAFDPRIYGTCEEAFLQGFELEIAYCDRLGQPSHRVIQPQGLLVMSPRWYLMAWDTGKQAPRTFRLDRIERAEPLRHRAFQAMDPRELFREIRAHGLDLGF